MLRAERENGHAIIEVLFLGLVLIVPVVWLLTVLAEVHAAALATSSAVRESGFEAARAVDPISADDAIAASTRFALSDHGLDPGRGEIRWSPPAGWGRGATLEVVVTYRVPVFQAPLLGSVSEPSLPVTARHVVAIDRYRSRDAAGE